MSDQDVWKTLRQPGDTPAEPEDEGFRDELIEKERERRERQAQAAEERRTEAIKTYKGVENIGDKPGSALAGDTGGRDKPQVREGKHATAEANG